MEKIWRPLWQGWLWVGKRLGQINGAILLTLLYLFILGLYGIMYRAYRLFAPGRPQDTYWKPKHGEATLESMRRQF